MEIAFVQTPLGIAKIIGDAEGLTGVTLIDNNEPISTFIPAVLTTAVYQINEYFEGTRTTFDLPLKPSGTPFQLKVWKALQEIPFGTTISYLVLSKTIGDFRAVRAVAAANGKNPLWIIIPCHRVIGSDGSLTGYAGGLHRKKWLLAHECNSEQLSFF